MQSIIRRACLASQLQQRPSSRLLLRASSQLHASLQKRSFRIDLSDKAEEERRKKLEEERLRRPLVAAWHRLTADDSDASAKRPLLSMRERLERALVTLMFIALGLIVFIFVFKATWMLKILASLSFLPLFLLRALKNTCMELWLLILTLINPDYKELYEQEIKKRREMEQAKWKDAWQREKQLNERLQKTIRRQQPSTTAITATTAPAEAAAASQPAASAPQQPPSTASSIVEQYQPPRIIRFTEAVPRPVPPPSSAAVRQLVSMTTLDHKTTMPSNSQ